MTPRNLQPAINVHPEKKRQVSYNADVDESPSLSLRTRVSRIAKLPPNLKVDDKNPGPSVIKAEL